MKRIAAGILFALSVSAAVAQAPPPVPTLPDTQRLTTYSISASTCACSVNFALYGDSTDYANWLQVWVNGVQMAQSGNWTITSPTGPLATIPRPITDAVLTFTAAQTGTVQIVGARRPRRLSQFTENRGVAARDLNQAVTDLVAENREQWDALLRSITAPPGDTAPSLLLPPVSARASKYFGFDANGSPVALVGTGGSGGNVTGPAGATNNDFACFNGTTGLVIKDCGLALPMSLGNGGTGQTTAAAARGPSGLNIDQFTPKGDTNYTILSTDRTVGTNATLTAARTWTLPAANSVNPGQTVTVSDYANGVTSTNTLTIQRAGSDTIIAGTSPSTSVAINVSGGRFDFRSDGVSKWSAAAITSGSASGQLVNLLSFGAKCDGSTDDSTAIQTWLNALPTAGKGIIPAGLTCLTSGIITVPTGAYWGMSGATLKAKNSAAGNTCICFSASDQLSTGPSHAGAFGGTFDGNKANRTSTGASYVYINAATDIVLQNNFFINAPSGKTAFQSAAIPRTAFPAEFALKTSTSIPAAGTASLYSAPTALPSLMDLSRAPSPLRAMASTSSPTRSPTRTTT